MRVDLRAVLSSALDVAVPPFSIESIARRATDQHRAERRTASHALLTIAAFVAIAAIGACGYSSAPTGRAALAALPVPAPAPLST
jgi:hypothetical protein